MKPLIIYTALLLFCYLSNPLFIHAIGSNISSLHSTTSTRLAMQQSPLLDSLHTLLKEADLLKYSSPAQALDLAQDALSTAQKNQFKFQEAKAQQILSRLYAEDGRYELALEANNAALAIFLEFDDPRESCNTYIHRGVIYRYLTLYEQSIETYQKAEALALQHEYTDYQAAVYGNMGNVYFDQQDYDKALRYHLQSLKIDENRNNEQGIGNTSHNIGQIYRQQQDYTTALQYYEKSLAVDLKKNNLRNIGLSYLEFTEVFMEMQDFSKALFYAEKTLEIADSLGSVRLKKLALAELPLISAALGNTASALRYQEQFKHLNDSLHSAELSEQIAALQTEFEVEQKDKELNLQHLRLEAQQTSLGQQRILTLGVIVIALLGALIAFLFFNRYKLTQKNQQLSLENEQHRLAQHLQIRMETDETIHYFASSLFGKNTVEEILWDVAKNCIAHLGLVDCVIYLLDESREVLMQKAAYGAKNPDEFEIQNPIEIPLGKGIVGSVAQSGEAELIHDTSQDSRYIIDDESRYSELAVPIKHQGKVIGVIDSEHPEKHYFTQYHLNTLKTIAAICASKIAQTQADKEARKAEQIRLEAEQIKAMDLMKSRFFANISHEFRTPLSLILGPLRSHGEHIPAQELAMMQRNAQRLLRLVNQLMDLSKLEVGQLQLEYQQADVLTFLRGIADSFKSMAAEKEIVYQMDIPTRRHLARFDSDKLEKMVYNLLSNAIKFTPPGGKVSIHVAIESSHHLRLAVSDTGLGIPAALQDKIFDRFYQVDNTNTRSYEGTGIGLALTKELVDLYQGSIRIDSEVQQGTSFVVILPLPPAEGEREEPLDVPLAYAMEEIALPDVGNREAIAEEKPLLLIVEDNPDLRTYIRNHLGNTFSCREAVHGQEGWKIALEHIPDLIITDVMMPRMEMPSIQLPLGEMYEMDGVELTRRIKTDERTSHIPVIMLTARDDQETKLKGFQTGADQYVTKPFDIAELRERVHSLLRQRRLLREKYGREIKIRPSEVTANDHDAAFLERCLKTVETHMSEAEFSVEQLQREIGMSRMQLHRKLKALTNQSATEFMRDIRLQRAAQLLQQADIQVAEVAYDVGFNHLSYFAKCFKEKFGIAPSDYAKKSSKPA